MCLGSNKGQQCLESREQVHTSWSCLQFGSSTQKHHQQNGGRQEEATETVGLEPLTCEERLQDQGWFSWEDGWLWGHPTACLVPMGGNGEDAGMLFTVVYGRRVRGSSTS